MLHVRKLLAVTARHERRRGKARVRCGGQPTHTPSLDRLRHSLHRRPPLWLAGVAHNTRAVLRQASRWWQRCCTNTSRGATRLRTMPSHQIPGNVGVR